MTPEEILSEASAPSSGGIPDLSSAIEKLMAHPEILQMAASVLGQNAPSAAASDDTSESSTEDSHSETEAVSAGKSEGGSALGSLPELLRLAGPLLSGAGKSASHGDHGKGIGRCTALLVALKPYLSPARCSRVDQIVQMSKFGALLGQLH